MRDAHPLPGSDLVVDGVRLHVVAHGRATGVPLLLLHGLPTSAYLWRDVARCLEHDARTVAPDLVGLGRSERPPIGGYDPGAQARRLPGLLDALGLDRVVVAGHGLGGAVAVLLAALAPDRVAGLALLASPLHPDAWPPPAVLPLTLPGVAPAYAGLLADTTPLRQLALRRGLGLPPGPVLDHYAAPLAGRAGARGLVRFVRAVDLTTVAAAWDLVRAAAPPTLLLWGSADRVQAPSYGRRLADALPAARWVPLADAGHLLPEERPERVAEELAGFRADLLGQSADQ